MKATDRWLDELFDLWRSQNPAENLYAENVAAVSPAIQRHRLHATRQSYERAQKREDGLLQPPEDATLDLFVSRDQLHRSLLLMDALFVSSAGPAFDVALLMRRNIADQPPS